MGKIHLKDLFENPRKIVITAHRGFSGKFPENTLLAFDEAAKLNVDMIEFDIRATKDNVPIILHDKTIDRTTDGKGSPNEYTLDELKKFDASAIDGRESYPNVTIPTFRELLDAVPENIGLNIQVYEAQPPEFLEKICQLYDEYDVYGRGYLTMSTFADAEQVRKINDKIDLCVLETQDTLDETELKRLKDFGCHIIQPGRRCVDEKLCKLINEMGFWANMFYSNTDEDNRRFIGYGMKGILTDFPDILKKTVADLGLE